MDSCVVDLMSSTWWFSEVNEAPKAIVVNGNCMEFHQYFLNILQNLLLKEIRLI